MTLWHFFFNHFTVVYSLLTGVLFSVLFLICTSHNIINFFDLISHATLDSSRVSLHKPLSKDVTLTIYIQTNDSHSIAQYQHEKKTMNENEGTILTSRRVGRFVFTDMRMSSSMYEVFNWNCTPDPPLTPAKNKRASLSLPPTTDIFSIDDMSMIDRPMIQRGASGESLSFSHTLISEVDKNIVYRIYLQLCFYLYLFLSPYVITRIDKRLPSGIHISFNICLFLFLSVFHLSLFSMSLVDTDALSLLCYYFQLM